MGSSFHLISRIAEVYEVLQLTFTIILVVAKPTRTFLP